MPRYEVNSQNTKEALSMGLKELVNKKNAAKVTINELCSKCDVNRNTFYYHFQDMRDLILWTLHKDFYQCFNVQPYVGNGQLIRKFVMDFLHDNSIFLNYAYDELGFISFNESCNMELYPVILNHIEYLEKKEDLSLKQNFKEFLAEYYSEQVGSLYTMQFRRPKQYNNLAVQKYLEIIFDYTIPDIILHQDDLKF